MARIIEEQKNKWGVQGQQFEPQRADLWAIDFSQAISGMNQQIAANSYDLDKLAQKLEPFFAASVTLPPLVVKAEEVRRDSRPYKMPSFDDSLGEIKVVFIFDTAINATSSKVYKVLDTWRAFVRAGRGSLGHESAIPALNEHYRIDYAFDVTLTLLRGSSNPQINAPNPDVPTVAPVFDTIFRISNDLEQTTIYSLESAWLGSFRITELDYARGNEVVKIDATFYAENILNEPVAV